MPSGFLRVELVIRLKHVAFQIPLPIVSCLAALHEIAFRQVYRQRGGSCAKVVMKHINAIVAQRSAIGIVVLGAVVLAAVERVLLSPIENHIVVEHIVHLCIVVMLAVGEVCLIAHTVEPRRAVQAVTDQAVAHRAVLPAPLRGIGAAAFLMLRVVEPLADDAPLHRGRVRIVECQALLHRPCERTMVNNHIARVLHI